MQYRNHNIRGMKCRDVSLSPHFPSFEYENKVAGTYLVPSTKLRRHGGKDFNDTLSPLVTGQAVPQAKGYENSTPDTGNQAITQKNQYP